VDDNAENIDELAEVVQVIANNNLPQPPIQFPQPENAVIQQMQLTRNGGINARSYANVSRIFETDTRWVGKLGYNQMTSTFVQRMTQDGFEPLNNGFISFALRWLSEVYGANFGKQTVKDALEASCEMFSFHPIQNYLQSLPDPETDDKGDLVNPICETFFIQMFGAVDTPLHRAYSRGFFIAAVKRAMQPGSKVDNMLVLVGDQGIGKSSMFERLCPDPLYFSDTKFKIGSKDAMSQIRGKWIIEIGELASIRKADNDATKQFLTSRVDSYRPAYQPYVVDYPRTCVFVGTVNEEAYLSDWTGNRRFWSMKVHNKVKSIDDIGKHRDKLWAEAYYRWKQGERYYLSDDLEKERERLSRNFMLDDGWEFMIDEFLGERAILRERGKKYTFKLQDILAHLGFEPYQIKGVHISRATTILKNLGCTKKRERRAGEASAQITVWSPPEDYKE